MKAMILAAGFGTRLKPITDSIPKALVPVQGTPVMAHVIASLKGGSALDALVVNTHYLPEQIEAFFKNADYPFPVHTSYEQEILGTGGGVYQAKTWLEDDHFWLHNADILCGADFEEMKRVHLEQNAMATLAVQERTEKSKLVFDGKNQLCGLDKSGEIEWFNQNPAEAFTSKGFCGIHLISPEIFQAYKEPFPFSIIELYKLLAKQGEKIIGWDIGKAYWVDIGTPQALEQANIDYSPS